MNTMTSGFYVRYLKHLEGLIGEGTILTPEFNKAALRLFATVPVSKEDVEDMERKDTTDDIIEGVKYVDQIVAERAQH